MGRQGRAVDWLKKFTPEEATKAIFGSDSYMEVERYDSETEEPFNCCEFLGVASNFFNCLLREIVRDETNFCLILGGEKLPNPLNALSKYQARFSRKAYYSWWVANPHGIACPEWFEDYAEDDGIHIGELPPSFEVLTERRKIYKWIRDREIIVRDTYDRLNEQIEALKVKLAEHERGDNSQIAEGLTVADVRAMCAHSVPLKSILVATANWHKIPNGYQQKRDDTALETLLSQQAKIDRWGTANDNGVAKEDLPILKRYITGNVKGRGKK